MVLCSAVGHTTTALMGVLMFSAARSSDRLKELGIVIYLVGGVMLAAVSIGLLIKVART